MKFKYNEDNKIVLKDKEGVLCYFDFPVDAREALEQVDENGEKCYSLLEPEKVKPKQKETDVDPGEIVPENTKKTTKKSVKKVSTQKK